MMWSYICLNGIGFLTVSCRRIFMRTLCFHIHVGVLWSEGEKCNFCYEILTIEDNEGNCMVWGYFHQQTYKEKHFSECYSFIFRLEDDQEVRNILWKLRWFFWWNRQWINLIWWDIEGRMQLDMRSKLGLQYILRSEDEKCTLR